MIWQNIIYKIIISFLHRFLIFLFLYISAPSILYVIIAWCFITDCDLSLLIKTNIFANEEKEYEYFENRICWVTGASSGLGQTIAIELAKRGAYVILSGRNIKDLKNTSNLCERAYLVSQVKTINRTDSTLLDFLDTSHDVVNARAIIIPFDLIEPIKFNSIVREGLSWKGRVDMIFNNAGISQRAIFSDYITDMKINQVNFLGPLCFLKAIVPSVLKNLPLNEFGTDKINKDEKMQYIKIKKLNTIEFNNILKYSEIPKYIKQVSLKKIENVYYYFKNTKYGIYIRKLLWGYINNNDRIFHVINICSILNNILTPGSSTFGASKTALRYATDVLGIEINAKGRLGKTSTDFLITNCYIGCVNSKNSYENIILSNGKAVKEINENSIKKANEYRVNEKNSQIQLDRCTNLILRATVYNHSEAWISNKPMLIYMYIEYYLPWVWDYISKRFYNFSTYNYIEQFNNDCINYEEEEKKIK